MRRTRPPAASTPVGSLGFSNGVFQRPVKTGETFEPGTAYSEIIGDYDCQFRPMDVSHYKDYVGWSIWFYDYDLNSFPMLQCFWPDKSGKFPWERGCEQWAIDAQPQLDKPKVKPPDDK
jgi:Domain of unknown function (DUF4262)